MTRRTYLVGLLTIGLSVLCIAGRTAEGRAIADLDARIDQLSKRAASSEEVIRLLGEPESYRWGGKIFTATNLPATYLLVYPGGVNVGIRQGQVWELRSEQPGPGFTWRGKLRLGSTLDEVLAELGPPTKTLTGEKIAFEPEVLYLDANGQKGSGYYSRADHGIRLFFENNKVIALYLAVKTDGVGGSASEGPVSLTPKIEARRYEDVRFKDLSKVNVPDWQLLLPTLTFNLKTVWPAVMPPGAEPARVLADAMNPGLGVRALHGDGLTGRGVNVAIIDQPLHLDHPEFAGKIVAYHDVGCQSESSMHGPGVASLLVGAKCGTAPDARVYYVAAPAWNRDSAYFATALEWIIDRNTELPDGEKIRVVSVSSAPSGPGSPFEKNGEMWDAVCARAEKAGILVLDCTSHRGLLGPCYYDAADPETVSKCKPGFPSMPVSFATDRLLVPCSPRTTAEEYVKGDWAFQYCGQGGLSWGIPYAAGVLALGWQARPELDGPQMRELLFSSAHITAEGTKIIDPRAFVDAVKRFPPTPE